MGFPTTVNEALALTPEQAAVYVDRLEEILEKKSADWDPPEHVLAELEDRFTLAAMIAVLNACKTLPDNPLSPDWTVYLPEEEAEEG